MLSNIPVQLRAYLIKRRRYFCEFFGIDRYSQPSLNQIDKRLAKYLSFRGGFFIEAGANNGYSQSNTYYLERFLGWRGILVEPIPDLYQACVKERPNSVVYNCALVSSDYGEKNVTMLYSNLMSLVKGAKRSDVADIEHVRRGIAIQGLEKTYDVQVPARTLNSILDESGVDKIDFLSLDVEGYELQALQGLDFMTYKPRYILVEANFHDEIGNYLIQRGYESVDKFSSYDVLYSIANEQI